MIGQIKSEAEAIWPKLVDLRRHLHAHPELSFQEFETVKFVKTQLEQIGLKPRACTPTGLVAEIKGRSEGKTIALRADMDALPIAEANDVPYKSQNAGIMHACGHDVHTACLLGAAEILHGLRNEFNGTVRLIFQPGEEKLPGGASQMIAQGVLKNPGPQAIFGQHVFPELEAGKVGFRPGMYMASTDEIYITVNGKGGHGAMPHQIVDPVLIASHLVVALQQLVSRHARPDVPTVLSIGRMEALGTTNVIPAKVEMQGTFRTFDEQWRNTAHEKIRKLATGLCESMGANCDVEIRRGYPFVHNNEHLTQNAMQWAQSFLGAKNVVNLDLRMTGEDFASYGQVIPGCFYRLGTGNKAKGIVHGVHTPSFDVDEKALETGSGLMAFLALQSLAGQPGPNATPL